MARHDAQTEVLPEEVAHELVGRFSPHLLGRRVLLEATRAQQRDAVGEQDRLVDVVGDEQDRLAELLLQPLHLVLQALAGERVDRAEGLVHEQQGGVGRERAGDADPLRLAARKLARPLGPVDVRVEPDQVEQLVDARVGPLPVPAEQARHGRDVLADGHVGEQPDALDHVAHRAPQLLDLHAGGVAPVDEHPAARRLDHAVDHAQHGGLPRARGAEQHGELALATERSMPSTAVKSS